MRTFEWSHGGSLFLVKVDRGDETSKLEVTQDGQQIALVEIEGRTTETAQFKGGCGGYIEFRPGAPRWLELTLRHDGGEAEINMGSSKELRGFVEKPTAEPVDATTTDQS